MTTAAWTTVLDHTTDAGFRAWGSELSAKFAAASMVQTADTGQINWSTVVRSAPSNTAAGYEIWKLSSGNLFFKIEYGTGVANVPALFLTVGTGSNGSGTLTGQLSSRITTGATGVAVPSTSTNYQSYLCATANYFGLSWKINSASVTNQARNFMGACQTVDSTGAATSIGYLVLGQSGSGLNCLQAQCVAAIAGVAGVLRGGSSVNPNIYIIPNNSAAIPTNSLDGSGNSQAFLYWYSILGTTPMIPMLHFAAALASDISLGTTASMTLVGTTAHTYIAASAGMAADAANILTGVATTTQLMMFE